MKTNTNTSELKSRSEQLSTAKRDLVRINFARRRVNRSLDRETLLALLRGNAPRFFELAEVVGQWVWIQFAERQPRAITSHLAELGFHWNNTRQAWQHPCGLYRHEAASFDPRKVYGSYFAADFIPAWHRRKFTLRCAMHWHFHWQSGQWSGSDGFGSASESFKTVTKNCRGLRRIVVETPTKSAIFKGAKL